mmetsp:Transcript_12669/g.38709  ORF Transcript_12669/g.38709 Transcript_12669/m.38709 type:complete len:262 (-) Transcript_12669:1588-2373(-)
MTRESTVAPTLAPQPPQRMDACERALSASAPAAVASSLGGPLSIPILVGSPVVYAAIHVRSIQSFRPQSHFASRQRGPLEATQPPSPVPMRPRNLDWGSNGSSGLPRSLARKFFVRGGPWRTAKTPALGRGYFSTAATSPAAKMPGWETDSRVGCTATKPAPSSSSGVCVASQGAAPPWVHQMASSYSICRPLASSSLPLIGPRALLPPKPLARKPLLILLDPRGPPPGVDGEAAPLPAESRSDLSDSRSGKEPARPPAAL